MLRLEDLRPAPGSHKRGKRVGRGDGSGRGKTAGRGTKGQKSRSGYQIPPGFEGGQTPLWRRVPKRGFKNPLRREYAIVNLETLAARYPEGAEISPEDLLARGIIKKRLAGVKVLGRCRSTVGRWSSSPGVSALCFRRMFRIGCRREEGTPRERNGRPP